MIRTTFSIPKALKERLDKRPDVNWSTVFRNGLKKKLDRLEVLKARGEL